MRGPIWPAVLGIGRWRELQEPLYVFFLMHALEHLVDEKFISPRPLEPIAQLICGALMQAGMGIAQSDDPDAALESYDAALQQLYRGLLRDGS